MTDLAGAVQIALFTKLSAVQGLPPVVTEVPIDDRDQPIYPFILLGDDQVTDVSSKDGRIERHEPAIHVCMQSTTKLAVRAMQALVHAALHDQPIEAPGAVLSNPKARNQSTPLLEDGATYVGSQIFLIFAQDA